MEQNKRQFYKEISEKNAKEIQTSRMSRTTKTARTARTNSYQGYSYKSSNKNEEEHTFKSKFLMQSLIALGIVGCFYMLGRNDSSLSKAIIEKTKTVLNTNINIENLKEDLKELKEDFSLSPSIVKGDESKIYIDDEQIEKMEEDLEEPPKN